MFAFQGLSLVFGWFGGVAPFRYNFHSVSYNIDLIKVSLGEHVWSLYFRSLKVCLMIHAMKYQYR